MVTTRSLNRFRGAFAGISLWNVHIALSPGLEYAFEDGLLTDEPDVRLHCADYFTGITVYGIGEDGEVHILYKGNCA